MTVPAELPRRTEKPWGFELLYALTPQYAGKVIFVKAGHRLSFQYHQKKDESLYLHQGKARIVLEGSEGRAIKSVIEPGFCIHIQPMMKHRLEAIEDALFFEVSTSELDDVVRLQDDYGRG